MSSATDPVEALRRAVEVFNTWRERHPREPVDELLACHEDLHALLEPMVAPMLGATAADVDPPPPVSGLPDLDGFHLIREVGRGGMGVVYEARQVALGRRVAIKVLPAHLTLQASTVARFKREAATAAKLTHPNIVQVHGVGSSGDVHWFAMEYIEGAALDRVLAGLRAHGGQKTTAALRAVVGNLLEDAAGGRREPAGLPPEFAARGYVATVVDWTAQIADALAHAHAAQVIHRDVKPSNVLLRADGHVVLTDFGLAREADLPSMTRTGDFAGTPYYIAPEQAMAKRVPVDHRADVFSLGVTLYELLTLRRPFDGETAAEVLAKIVGKEPLDPQRHDPELASDLCAIVLKAIDKDPDRRYPSAEAFAADLRAFLDYRPVAARRATRVQRFTRWVRREPRLASAVLGLFAALAAALVTTLLLLRSEQAAARREREERQRMAAALDGAYVDNLRRTEGTLWPSVPEKVAAMESWLAQARDLLGRMPAHEAAFAAFGNQPDAELPAEVAWRRRTLQELVEGLRALADLVPRVEARAAFAGTVAERSIHGAEAAAAWKRAIEAVVAPESPYGGLDLTPQLGLLPIGPDPVSGLQEFWHLESGAAPQRDAHGRAVVGEDTGIVFVLIPGGSLVMRETVTSQDGSRRELSDTVRLEPYFLSKYEMTQGQWQRLTGNNPSRMQGLMNYATKQIRCTPAWPVDNVSWTAATEVLGRIGLVLPTEAQWEFAARAGTTTRWWTGDDVESVRGAGNLSDLSAQRTGSPWAAVLDWPDHDDGYPATAPVGCYAANAFGLHDVIGNVVEWCRDDFTRYTNQARPGDGLRKSGHEHKVARGGCFGDRAAVAASGQRERADPHTHGDALGVRPARVLERH
ncbi:MAG TPA: bifunctional serine/threonine-protein kinase/formylglycine-generating enzyme family protein [Planctomycetota bacterium]|nr:bifunctional serine/threonine-protein kinase/formylglycine-generating enzyme family protein [Planctomycetota bacterium]